MCRVSCSQMMRQRPSSQETCILAGFHPSSWSVHGISLLLLALMAVRLGMFFSGVSYQREEGWGGKCFCVCHSASGRLLHRYLSGRFCCNLDTSCCDPSSSFHLFRMLGHFSFAAFLVLFGFACCSENEETHDHAPALRLTKT